MKITRDKKTHGTFDTDLYCFLSNVPEELLKYSEHGLRHPLAIYNISSSRVYNAIENFIILFDSFYIDFHENDGKKSELNKDLFEYNKLLSEATNKQEIDQINFEIKEIKTQQEKISKHNSQLMSIFLQSYREILDALMSFIDDCYHIMKCFYPITKTKEKIVFADKWIKKADIGTYNFFINGITKYRESVAPIVNKIKHNHARMRFIEYETNNGATLGYYIEGVGAKGELVPDPFIHAKYKGMHTAFSFNREIKNNLLIFYFIAHHLKVTLERLTKKTHNMSIDINLCNKQNDIEIFNLCSRIASLPLMFFLDEYIKAAPEIIVGIENQYILFSYKKEKISIPYNGAIKITSITSGDGVSKSFGLPYFGGK